MSHPENDRHSTTESSAPKDQATTPAEPLSFDSVYCLTRDYLSECFDESAPQQTGLDAYRKALLLTAIGAALFATEISPYAPWFFIALGGIEYLSVRYRRSWWIARQMFARTAGSQINLTLSEQGIAIVSVHQQQTIDWRAVQQLDETERGFVITHRGGRSYLSKAGLTVAAIDFLRSKD